jgi:GNAT superfamily N-acetyltransferase
MRNQSRLQIRRAEPRDQPTIVDFNVRLAWETEDRQLDPSVVNVGVSRVLSGTAEAHYLVAELSTVDGPAIVGQLMLTREWSDWRNGWNYWIQSVYVAPEARGQGVFRSLHRAAVEFVEAADDAVGLRLYAMSENTVALNTYARLGMQPTGYVVLEHAIRDRIPPQPSR